MQIHGPIGFVAGLFLLAACITLIGAEALWQKVDYTVNGLPAVMVLADSSKKLTVPRGGVEDVSVDVKYVRPDGELLVTGLWLDGSVARNVAAGGRIPIKYWKNDVRHFVLQDHEFTSPWERLAVGALLLGVAIYALKLLRRQHSAASHRLGRPAN